MNGRCREFGHELCINSGGNSSEVIGIFNEYWRLHSIP